MLTNVVLVLNNFVLIYSFVKYVVVKNVNAYWLKSKFEEMLDFYVWLRFTSCHELLCSYWLKRLQETRLNIRVAISAFIY